MFSHIDDNAQPTMVDVSKKNATRRTARARTIVQLPPEVMHRADPDEIQTVKGPVFQTAIIAGVMAAKKTHHLIPFCHPLGIEKCAITIDLAQNGQATINCAVTVHHKTGVEMEALTGASVAALTVYDMCKSISHDIVIRDTRLIEKRGGKSDIDAPGQR
ncbi:MAG: cyclic pyranopterin monophosphate synthase MoaC [Pseudomonadota bacterium]